VWKLRVFTCSLQHLRPSNFAQIPGPGDYHLGVAHLFVTSMMSSQVTSSCCDIDDVTLVGEVTSSCSATDYVIMTSSCCATNDVIRWRGSGHTHMTSSATPTGRGRWRQNFPSNLHAPHTPLPSAAPSAVYTTHTYYFFTINYSSELYVFPYFTVNNFAFYYKKIIQT
jgi:hypothetical protein